eukprot:8317585-Pyramimonas_sp.AAC.4
MAAESQLFREKKRPRREGLDVSSVHTELGKCQLPASLSCCQTKPMDIIGIKGLLYRVTSSMQGR